MNTSSPARTELTSRPPSPQESPLDSGFASRGPVHLTGLTFSEDDSEIVFKHPHDDRPSDNNTTIVNMGEIADLKAANTQLQRIVAQLKASLADVASFLRQQVSDAHKRVAALEYTDMRSLVSSAGRAEHQFYRLRHQADEMNVVDCPPQDLNC